MATRSGDATILQQGIVVGVSSLRGRGRQFRLLVDGRGEQTTIYFGSKEEKFTGEEGAKGRARGSCGACLGRLSGPERDGRVEWSLYKSVARLKNPPFPGEPGCRGGSRSICTKHVDGQNSYVQEILIDNIASRQAKLCRPLYYTLNEPGLSSNQWPYHTRP